MINIKQDIIKDYWFLRENGRNIGAAILGISLAYERKDIDDAFICNLYTSSL